MSTFTEFTLEIKRSMATHIKKGKSEITYFSKILKSAEYVVANSYKFISRIDMIERSITVDLWTIVYPFLDNFSYSSDKSEIQTLIIGSNEKRNLE